MQGFENLIDVISLTDKQLGSVLREILVKAENFESFINELCLTDNQKKMAKLKYLKGYANIDISMEMEMGINTVTKEMKEIRTIIGKSLVEKS